MSFAKYNIEMDMLAFDLVKQLPHVFPEIEMFYFIKYKPTLGVPERLAENEDVIISRRYDALFGQKKWDFEREMIERVNSDSSDVLPIVLELLRHNYNEADSLIEVKASDISTWLEKASKDLKEEEALGLVSRCRLRNNDNMQIPFMDFSCSINEQNELFLAVALKEMGFINGALLNSGKSYHFYGFKLFSNSQWISFMGQCLLISPFSDVRFIAHRVLSGHAILRITRSKLKPQVPKIINIL